MRRPPGKGAKRAFFLLPLVITVALSGCNIFGWTHDEGGSSDAETLLDDAQDALLDRNYDQALEFAEKGIAADPGLDFPRLRYVATQAVLGRSGISITSYLNVLTSNGKTRLGGRDALQEPILDLSLEELRAIAESCPQAVAFLVELVDGLENGTIGPEDLLGIEFDVQLGFSVGALLTAFVTTLDDDQNLGNGFVQNQFVTIEAFPNGGYTFAYSGPGDQDAFILNTLVCPLWPMFCSALEGMYDAYVVATAPEGWPANLGCGFAGVPALPVVLDESLIIGQALDFVHAGIQQLYNDWASRCGGASLAVGQGGVQ